MASPPCTAQKYSESNGDVPRYIWVNLSIELTRLLSFRMEVVTQTATKHNVYQKHAPPRSVCQTLRLGAGAAAQDHTPSGAWGSLTPTRPRLFYNAAHMVRCKKSRMGWCTLASHVHVVNVQTAQQLRHVSQYTKKTESHAGCLKEKQRQHVLKRTLAPVACALMPIQSPVTPHYG